MRQPIPLRLDRGLITAMAKRFAAKAVSVRVAHNQSKPYRKKGDETCTYSIAW